MKKKKTQTPSSAEEAKRFPEYVPPRLGEKVQSFAVRDEHGRKRTVYVRDTQNGYPYQGK